uniref:RNA helicase n=1 Tax=Mimivirus LCMiAC01 TaxID=2506608 RepID=A0A481YZ12_9VIRU|nr:MAG: DEAD/DEAH box helicase [Mimivirus LCMiAC01]
MEYYFITKPFENDIKKNVIELIFPKLNASHQQLLHTYLIDIVDIIAIKFNFDISKRLIYEQQFKQNNYRDLVGLLYILLPYIDDDDNKKKKNIRSLNDIYIAKNKDSVRDINEGEPSYIYSNLQYGRCDRSSGNNTEIQFNPEHLSHNYNLLKETIQIISNKLYVNWLDVRPMDILSYTDSVLYKNTKVAIDNRNIVYWDPSKNDNEDMKSAGRKYNGLYVGDIYNVIFNNLYHAIKNIKWLIYDILINEQKHSGLVAYNMIFDLDNCVNGISWEQLDDNSKNKFRETWNDYINSALLSHSYKGINGQIISDTLKTIMIFFDKYYENINEAAKKDNYIKLKILYKGDIDDIDIDEEYIKRLDINISKIWKNIKSLDPKHMYMYIKSCIDKFKNTWYSKNYLDYKNKKYHILSYHEYTKKAHFYNFKYEYNSFLGPKTLNFWLISAKNIYNFAKSLTHYTDKSITSIYNFKPYPRYWRSLESDDKKEILNRLNWSNNNDVTEWFNISNYVRNIYKTTTKQATKDINKFIHIGVLEQLSSTLFECLITGGILSEFVPDSRLTDKSNFSSQFTKYKKEIKMRMADIVFNDKEKKNKEKWKSSYYYLTGTKYDDMNEIIYEKNKKQQKKKYLKFLEDEAPGLWYTTYAMDWISQIAFFHRYLNNRVIYITGATGVGKSSQIPKLLLYALKMIDYKYSGKIIATQPRIPPTIKNAETIALQMGVPIKEYNKSIDANIISKNYYIQYKYSKSRHSNKVNHLMLRMVTDGMLYQELKNNPILKKKINNEYTNENVYDIVVVDEAHEHNKNMDLILTIMRNALYYNNSLKLIIISATMGNDEPNYRRYYRNINDNKMYPFNWILSDNKLDRINVDRRLHISPPGETTRFKIKDHDRIGKKPNDIVLEIIKTTKSGDILYFQPGRYDIKKAVQFLNNNTPDNVIAMPYHGLMPSHKKTIIEDLNDDTRKQIRIPKDLDFDSEYDEDDIKKVNYGTYDRVIIIATNLAEASITIDTLRYVVDTGESKVGKYDYKTRSLMLVKQNISQSSSTQRRGRVGRTRDGDVYYTYNRDNIKNNQIQYDISISDISIIMYDILQENDNEEPLFKQDPNTRAHNISHKSFSEVYAHGIHLMIKAQYYNKDKWIEYKGNNEHYDYNNNTKPHVYNQTGYAKDTLTDSTGTFYIIHPEELNMRRNISGKLIGIGNEPDGLHYDKNKHDVVSYKMNTFWDILTEFNLIVKNKQIHRTQYGINISKLMQVMDMHDVRYIISYVYSRKYECSNEMAKLIPMYMSMSMGIANLLSRIIIKGKSIIPIQKVRGIYGDKISDSSGLLNIINNLFKYLVKNGISLDVNNQPRGFAAGILNIIRSIKSDKKIYIANRESKDFSKLTKKYKKNSELVKRINRLIYLDGINKLSNSDEINDAEEKEFIKIDVLDDMLNKIYDNMDIFDEWWKKNNINNVSMLQYIKSYIQFNNKLYKIINPGFREIDYDNDDKGVDFEWFDKNLMVKYIDDNKRIGITHALLRGYGYYVVKKMNKTKLYIHINAPDPANMYMIKTIHPKVKIEDTLLHDMYRHEYMMFLRIYGGEEIYMLHPVTPKMIQSNVYDTYKPEKILEKYLDDTINIHRTTINKMISSIDSTKEDDYRFKLRSNMVGNYISTLNQIKMDMMNNYDPNIWNTIKRSSNVSQQHNQYAAIRKMNGQQYGGKNINYKNTSSVFIRYLAGKICMYYASHAV